MSQSINDIKFADLLPDSIFSDPQIAAAAEALDEEFAAIREATEKLAIWSRIDEIEEPLLSELAWHLAAPVWDPDADVGVKREVIKNAIKWHRRLGTPGAVKSVVAAMFGGATLREWYETGGRPRSFEITVESDVEVTPENIGKLYLYIANVKNTRSFLDRVVFKPSPVDHAVYIGAVPGALEKGHTYTEYPDCPLCYVGIHPGSFERGESDMEEWSPPGLEIEDGDNLQGSLAAFHKLKGNFAGKLILQA